MTAENRTIRDTPILISMSTRQCVTKVVLTLATIVTTLGAFSPASVNATIQEKRFAFGPGTAPPTSSATATLNVPARTTIRITGLLNPVSGLTIGVPVVVDVFRPGETSSAASLTTLAAPLVAANQPSVPFAFLVETFTSQVGCPSTWRVRVRTQNNSVPSAAVTGSVIFDFQRPGIVNLDMVGDSISVNRNDTKTRNLAGHDTLGVANSSLIAGTGTFRIKAKWDTDPGDVFHLGQFWRVNVALLRPNGSVADSETGRSQHYNGSLKKVDFSYTVTPADAAMTGGPWKLRIRNTVGSEQVKIVNFDIENFAFPGFKSTFQAACN